MDDMTGRPAAADLSRPRPRMGLSGKLLLLTLLFVMIAEVAIYVPSVASFRLNWLNDRLSAAYTAALVFETAPSGEVPEAVARQILQSIRARADPENPARIIAASERSDEIGVAERELAAMQLDLAGLLQQKTHLAALGLAVSKINHDLRNLLSSAQLFSERLAKISDPHVQRFAPKLMVALERAIAFCQSTLSYGRVQEPPPDRRPVSLELLVEDVRETLGLDSTSPLRWISAVERGLT